MDSYGDVKFHARLVRDRRRTQAYRRAIHQGVEPGDVVLDVGTGTGLLACFACQAGAARVYAVDRSEIIQLAQQLARRHDWGHKIRFLHSDIRAVELPEAVDVIVSELVSKAVLGQRMEELITYCRDRYLKPGGRLIPRSVELQVVAVDCEQIYQRLELPPREIYQLDFSPVRPWIFNNVHAGRFAARCFLAQPQVAYRLDCASARPSQAPRARLRFDLARAGTLHGFAAWFRARLSERVALDNHPPGMPSWDQAFFPLLEPVAVAAGCTVELDLSGIQTRGGPTLWRWNTRVTEASGGSTLAQFQQSTFSGQPLTQLGLMRRSLDFKPQLSPRGTMFRAIVGWVDGAASASQIAERLLAQYPGAVGNREEADDFVRATLLGLASGGCLT